MEPENAEDLARAVIEVLTRDKDKKTWREEIAAYAKDNYSQDAIISELEDLYRKII